MLDEPSKWNENPARNLAGLIAAPDGDRWIYQHRVRCPSCESEWVCDVASPRGYVDPKPDPVRWGMACLCGRCEARRRVLVSSVAVSVRDYSKSQKMGRLWTEDDERRAWAVLRKRTKEFSILVERLPEPFSGQALRDDKTAELKRILIRADGRTASVLTEESLRKMNLWDEYQKHLFAKEQAA